MERSARRPPEGGRGRWSLGRRSAPGTGAAGIDAAEAAEIDALLAASHAAGPELAVRLSVHLRPLVQRSVPPRAIEAAPVPRAARLRFADGTTVVVKSAVPGDVGVLCMAMRRGSVRPTGFTTDPDGSTHLVLTWPGQADGLWLRVTGLDQPD